MKKPASPKKQTDLLFLLVDKQGSIGKAILLQLYKEKISFSAVFATKNFSPSEQNVLLCPFLNIMPFFPDGNYTHIIVVYNGEKEVLDALSDFSKKTQEFGGTFFVVLPIHLYTKDIGKKIQAEGHNIQIIIVGDVFGKDLLYKGTAIDYFFRSIKKEERIVISGMGLESTYPVHIEDVALIITRTVFVKKEKKTIFFAFPKYPPTKLSLARMFQKINPILRIDFVGEEKKNTVELPAEGVYLLDNTYKFEQKIRDVFDNLTQKEFSPAEEELFIAKVPRKKIRFFTHKVFLFIIIFLLFPFISTGFGIMIGAYNISQSKHALEKSNIAESKEYAKRALSALTIAEKTFRVITLETSIVRLEEIATMFEKNLAFEKAAAQILLETGNTVDFWTKKNGVAVQSSARQIIILLQTIRLQKENTTLFPTTSLLSSILGLINDIAGFAKPKTYLVLLQNNMELRPGGGFIGSYGIAHVDKGRVSFSLHDVYDADGQLKGHVEPPFPIRRYLKSVHWYLRDSNFFVDFPTSASASAFFLKQETGEAVDGVIAVDVSFVKMLVEILGQIEVLDYKETVTKDNFYTVVQKHAEKDFFPGSTQKKDFLLSLFHTIQTSLLEKDASYKLLYQAVLNGFAQKHLLVAFPNESVQNVFAVNNMSSSLWQGSNTKNKGIDDFLGISEANVGVNKANVGITRRLLYDVVIDNNASVSARLTIIYKNEKKLSEAKSVSGGNNAYAADYKNYLRIIVPKGTIFTSIAINGEDKKLISAITDPKIYEAKNFIEPKGLEISREDQDNKTLYGFLVNVPLGVDTSIVVNYLLPYNLLKQPSLFAYDHFFYKQQGTDTYPYTFSLSYPNTITLVSFSKDVQKKEGKLILQTTLLGDVKINAIFGQK